MKLIQMLFILFCIHEISYAQNSNKYEVFAIRFATEKGKLALSFAAAGGSEKDSIRLCDMFWLLVGNGKHILVDAGYPQIDYNKDWDSIYIRRNYRLR